VEIPSETGTFQIGIIVDAVSEVLNIKGEDVEETPSFGSSLNTSYILGMAKIEGGVKILLDIDQVLTGEEVGMMSTEEGADSFTLAEAVPETASEAAVN